MPTVVVALLAGILVPIGLMLYLLAGEALLKRLRPRRARSARIALWLAPAGILLGGMLIYPLIRTIILSFQGVDGSGFVGLSNYVQAFTRSDTLIAIRNNLLWLVVFTSFVTVIGIAIATLGDRVKYEKLVRTIIVLPTAISFVGAGVIWSFVYSYEPPGLEQTGTLNAIWTTVFPGSDPVAWLADERTVNGALIFIGIWMSVGMASVILSRPSRASPARPSKRRGSTAPRSGPSSSASCCLRSPPRSSW